MPQFYLSPADMQTRQRVGTGNGDDVEIFLQGNSSGFISGDFVDIVRVGQAKVIVSSADAANHYAPVSNELTAEGQYIRATYDDETQLWDFDFYAADQNTLFAFQVGVPSGDHLHYVPMTAEQARTLMNSTNKDNPPGSIGAQPYVNLVSDLNGPSPHQHTLEVYFDYVNSTFTVENISNNLVDNHVASLIGTPSLVVSEPFGNVLYANSTNDGITSGGIYYIPDSGLFSVNEGITFSTEPDAVEIFGASTSDSEGTGAPILLTGGGGTNGGYITLTGGARVNPQSRISPFLTVSGTRSTNNVPSIEVRAGFISDGSEYPFESWSGEIIIGGGYTTNASASPDFRDILFEAHASDHLDLAVNAGIAFETSGQERLRISGTGAYHVDNDAGVPGYVLVSGGPDTTPYWDVPRKPAPAVVVDLPTSDDLGSALHHNQHFRSSSVSAITVTIQPDSFFTGPDEYFTNDGYPTSPGPMPIGGRVQVGKHAAGDITFAAGAGVTINSPETLQLTRLHGKITLIKVAVDEWDIEGNLVPI